MIYLEQKKKNCLEQILEFGQDLNIYIYMQFEQNLSCGKQEMVKVTHKIANKLLYKLRSINIMNKLIRGKKLITCNMAVMDV